MQLDVRTLAAGAELLQDRIRNGHTGSIDSRAGKLRMLADDLDAPTVEALWPNRQIDSAAAHEHAAFDRWPEDESLPDWIGEFERRVVTPIVDTEPSIPAEFEFETPFVDLLWPIVERNQNHVVDEVSSELLEATTHRTIQRLLVTRLADIVSKALYVDFIEYLEENDLDSDDPSDDSTASYEEYVTAIRNGRIYSFFETFPVAAKLLTVTVKQWEDGISKFCSRLRDDLAALTSRLDIERPTRVAELTPLGDPHSGGQQVLLVEFDTGDEVLYKPRNVEPERSLYRFQRWLTDEFSELPALDDPTVLVRSDYGWVERVDRKNHETSTSVSRYYRGAGALLVILYLLGITDCHCENVIASELSPVVVDPETLFEMGSVPAETADKPPETAARWQLMNETVVGTATLPHRDLPDKSSGYAGIEERPARTKQCSWVHTNTDAMEPEYGVPTSNPEENFPTLDGQPARPQEFIEEITDGFETTYERISESKDRINSALFEAFDGIETRVLLRNSMVYGALLETVTTPDYLRSGARYGFKIRSSLAMRPENPVLVADTKFSGLPADRWDDIIAAECQAIHRRDIPKFTMRADENGLYFDGQNVVTEMTDRTGMQRITRRLAELSEADKRRQVELIRSCLGEDGDRT